MSISCRFLILPYEAGVSGAVSSDLHDQHVSSGHSRDHYRAAILRSTFLFVSLDDVIDPFSCSHTQQPVLRLYAVPANAFTAEEEDEEAPFDGEDGEA